MPVRFGKLLLPAIIGLVAAISLEQANAGQNDLLYRWDYASKSGWKVDYYTHDRHARDFAYCQMSKNYDGGANRLRFTLQDTAFTLDFMNANALTYATKEGATFPISYVLDNAALGTAQAEFIHDPEGVAWDRITEQGQEATIERLKVGQSLVFAAGADNWQYSLENSVLGFDLLVDCYNSLHQKGNASPAPETQPTASLPWADLPSTNSPPPSPTPATTCLTGKQVLCSLSVKGKIYMSGACQYEASQDGSFRLSGTPYTVALNMTEEGKANAFWNADANTTQAQSPLGELRNDGACWVNEQVIVCAWDK